MRKSPFNRIDLINQVFGRLTVVSESDRRNQQRYWHCVCECGNKVVVSQTSLRGSHTNSCGCLHKEMMSSNFSKHKRSRTPEYEIWKSMRQRCSNPNNKSFANYGGRGIKVCERWNEFSNFLQDMGNRPNKTFSIERIDNDKGYQPDNCRWASLSEQSYNKRSNHFIMFNNQNLSLSQWAKKIGISPSLLHSRLYRLNWSVEKSLTTPKALA